MEGVRKCRGTTASCSHVPSSAWSCQVCVILSHCEAGMQNEDSPEQASMDFTDGHHALPPPMLHVFVSGIRFNVCTTCTHTNTHDVVLLSGDGWSARYEDSTTHGCIPVIIMDNTLGPFESQIDYSKFAIRYALMCNKHPKSVCDGAVPSLGLEYCR